MKHRGVLDHEHHSQGGCDLKDDCRAKGEKLLRVIKLGLNSSGKYEGEEIDLKGGWCDLCLKMGKTSVVGFTCFNENCPGYGKRALFNLCSTCDKHGRVKCPYSGPEWQWKYPGDHKFERAAKSDAFKPLQEIFRDFEPSTSSERPSARDRCCQIL